MVYDEKARVKKVESFFGGVYNENESASKKFFYFSENVNWESCHLNLFYFFSQKLEGAIFLNFHTTYGQQINQNHIPSGTV